MPAAVNRHLLKSGGYDAGIHVQPSAADPEILEIQIFQPPGITATPELVQEIEKHFARQEFRRAAWDEVGEITFPARAAESYVQDLLDTLDVDAIRSRRFRLVIDYSFSAASLVLPVLLGALDVEVVAAHPYVSERHAVPATPASPRLWGRQSAWWQRWEPTSASCSTARRSASISWTTRRAR